MGFSINETVNLEIVNLCVYAHKRKDTGEVFYIGMGKPSRPTSFSGRSSEWLAIVKNFGYSIELLATDLTYSEAIAKEIELIALYRKNSPNTLVNKTAGGQGHYGFKASEETKEKLRVSHTGYKHTPEQTAKIVAKTKGKKRSLESLEKMSKARLGVSVHTEFSRQKISDSKKGISVHTEESKRLISLAVSNRIIKEETLVKMRLAHKGMKMPEGFSEKISKLKMGNTNRLGMTRTPEEKAKISASLKGKPWSEARRATYLALGR